jgi:hypothetical protein
MGKNQNEVERLNYLLREKDAQIAVLTQRIAQLDAMLGRNSKNFSMPSTEWKRGNAAVGQ